MKSTINRIFEFVILSFFLFSLTLFTDTLFAEESVQCDKLNRDYFLSNGLREQTLGNLDDVKSVKNHQNAIESFSIFIQCSIEMEETIPSIVYYYRSLSYFLTYQFDLAMKDLNESIRLNENLNQAYFLKAKLLVQMGQMDKAREFLENHVVKFSSDPEFLYLIGTINFKLKNYANSKLYFTSLNDLVDTSGSNVQYKYTTSKYLGDLYFIEKNYFKSLKYYQDLITIDYDSETHLKMIQIMTMMNQLKNVKQEVDLYLELNDNPKDLASSEQIIAEIFYLLDRYTASNFLQKVIDKGNVDKTSLLYAFYQTLHSELESAKPLLLRFETYYPNRISIKLALYEVYKKENNREEMIQVLSDAALLAYRIKSYSFSETIALELLDFYTDNNEKTSEIYSFLAECYYNMGYDSRAKISYKKAIELTESEAVKKSLQLNLISLYRSGDDVEMNEAIQMIDKLLKDDEKSSYLYGLKGITYLVLGNYSDSFINLTEAIESDGTNASFYFYRAIAAEKLGNFESLEKDLLSSINYNPNDPTTYNYLGYLYVEKGVNLDLSQKLIKKAVELSPDNEAFQDSLGWMYYKLGNTILAKYHLNLARQIMIEKGNEDPVIYEHLGDVYKNQNENVNAREYWKKSLNLQTNDEDIIRIKTKIGEL